MTNEQRLAALLAEARAVQREQTLLITTRKNPARFGELERKLEGPDGLWAQIDALRAVADTTVTYYSVTPDYNVKCLRLFSHDDGIYAYDLGLLAQTREASEPEIARLLKARNPHTTWREK